VNKENDEGEHFSGRRWRRGEDGERRMCAVGVTMVSLSTKYLLKIGLEVEKRRRWREKDVLGVTMVSRIAGDGCRRWVCLTPAAYPPCLSSPSKISQNW